MPSPKLRPSGLSLAFKCLGSVVLPQHENESDAGTRGRIRHEKRAEMPAEAVRVLHELGIELDPATVATEQRVGYLGIHGTADFLAVTPEGHAVVLDWKGYAHVEGPGTNPQLLFYMLAHARQQGLKDGVAVIVYQDDDLNILGREMAYVDRDSLGAFELKLRTLLDRAEIWSDDPILVTGEHCRNCKALVNCPAQAKLLSSVLNGGLSNYDRPQLTKTDVAEIWRMLKAIKPGLDSLETTVRNYANQYPIEVDNGKVLGPCESSREEIDAEKARRVLSDAYGEKASQAFESKLTKASVVKHFGDAGLALLRQHGAAKTKLSVIVREHAA